MAFEIGVTTPGSVLWGIWDYCSYSHREMAKGSRRLIEIKLLQLPLNSTLMVL